MAVPNGARPMDIRFQIIVVHHHLFGRHIQIVQIFPVKAGRWFSDAPGVATGGILRIEYLFLYNVDAQHQQFLPDGLASFHGHVF